jgi:hypothetical protein
LPSSIHTPKGSLRTFTTSSEPVTLRFVPDSLSTRSSAPSLTVLDRDSDHVLLTYANVIVVLWSGRQVPQVCASLYDTAISLASQTATGKLAVLSVIQPTATAPSPAAREALGRLVQDPNGIVHRSALVYSDDGFLASIVRSVALTLMQRAARRRGHQVFQKVDKALEWITDGLPTATGHPLQLPSLVRQLEGYCVPAKSRVA